MRRRTNATARRTLITLLAFVFVDAAIACSGGGAGGVGDAGSDAGRTDGGVPDASTDGAIVDAGVDGTSPTCPPATNPALCLTEADCTFVLRGCYCGAQPALGTSKEGAPGVAACEALAAQSCALGCPTMPGIKPDEGNVVDAASQIGVRCDTTTGGSPGTCFTFAK